MPTAISNVSPRQRARHLPSDNPLLRLSASVIQEQFMPFHSIAQPGNRVSDLFSDRLFFELSAPKRSSKLFAAWVRDFKNRIDALKRSAHTIIFTDGAFWAKSARASYAYTAYHNGLWHDFSFWCPAGSSYDTELAALEDAIQWAVVNNIAHPVFFIDNKAVLTTFLDLDTHSSQMSSVRINILLHDHLSNSDNTLSFAFCPSHVGIEGNERADKLTKTGAAMGPVKPVRILRSNVVNDFRRDMARHWRVLSASQMYKGNGWLPIRRKKRIFKPDIGNKQTKSFFITMSGNNIETISRMARAITGHALTGEYRQRFHPDLATHCAHCGPEILHTRQHILFDCPKYVSLAASMTDWKKDKSNDKSWKSFFQANTSAFSFGDLPDDVH
ncbi:hypothetical protein AX14_008800 [Amanita brunnescens Koide BX004]|nr:hypothetical protein AX14_008800 [Amanita brunnescens Koide BX004]